MPVLAVMTRKLTRVRQAQVLEAFSATMAGNLKQSKIYVAV